MTPRSMHVATDSATVGPTGDLTADDLDSIRRRLRASFGVLFMGGLLFLAGVSRPVVDDWARAWESPEVQLSIARGAPDQFVVGFVLMGLGYLVMGVGAGLLLLAMARLFSGRRAVVARWMGWAGIAGGVLVGGERTVMTIVDYEREAVNHATVVGIAGTLGLGLAFAVGGLLSWNGPVWRWPSVAYALGGLLAMPTIPAVFMFTALGYGLVGVVQFRRGREPRIRYPRSRRRSSSGPRTPQ